MSTPYSTELHLASLAVLRASILTKSLLTSTTDSVSQQTKSDLSPVTIADFASQAVLISILRHAFPTDRFLAEENAASLRTDPALAAEVFNLITSTKLNGEDGLISPPATIQEMLDTLDIGGHTEDSASGRIWILDPIDGTQAFIQGTQYAVSLSLVVDGEQRVGVVGYPNLSFDSYEVRQNEIDTVGCGTMLFAVKGYGAYKRSMSADRNNAIQLSPAVKIERYTETTTATTSTTPIMEQIVFAESPDSPFIDSAKHRTVLDQLGVSCTVDLYAMQVKYAALSLGTCDAMIRIPRDKYFRPYVWDHAGGQLVFEEAGGIVTDSRGERFDYGAGRQLRNNLGLVAAGPDTHAKILEVMKSVCQW